ncbi:uncharacterized protein FN964_015856 isoform 2-T2 [Alca torda]
MSRHRLLTALALPAGAALAAAAAGSQFLCQAAEIPNGEKASAKEAKATNTKWWLSHKQERPARNGKCDLTGWWENELGSKMHVDAVDSQGNFTGEYYTAVSSAQKPIEPSPLLGSQHLDEDGQCTFGFTVNWKFSVGPSMISPHSGWCLQTVGHLLKPCSGEAASRVALTASLPQSISLQPSGPTWAP